MKQVQHERKTTIFNARWLAPLVVLIMFGALLHAVPARAGLFGDDPHFVSMIKVDVVCGNGLFLNKATGVANNAPVHTYEFGGTCDFRITDTDGTSVVGRPPLTASARWDQTSNTFTESLHLMTSTKLGDTNVGTGPEKANFKCVDDPALVPATHCTLISQHDSSGWHSTYEHGGDQKDGFAWQANHNRPLLLGRADYKRAVTLSKADTANHPPIQCSDLHLIDAAGVLAKKNKHTYKLNGTCQLYHTKDGNKGLEITHVVVNAGWDEFSHQAREGVIVLTKPIEGGGSWSTTYTCTQDPWIDRFAKCSKQTRLGSAPPVYQPITDLIDRRPIAFGKVSGDQAIKLSRAHLKKSGKSGKAHAHLNIHPGILGNKIQVRPAASVHSKPSGLKAGINGIKVPLLKLTQNQPVINTACTNLRNIITLRQTLHNDGAALPVGHATLSVKESTGAHIMSPSVAVPAMAHGANTTVFLKLGTQVAYRTKVPGVQRLPILLTVNGKTTTTTLTLRLPAHMCQTAHRTGVGGATKLNPQPEPPSAPHRLKLPAR